ncbi:hypothetical protein AB0N16_38860 [Streptomyces sp. NPDC051105]|uniref:hypothetical protein n=1 Tax=Streptomyces sp. NPDC051105 TaxID=3154843 RepID=UPI00341BE607
MPTAPGDTVFTRMDADSPARGDTIRSAGPPNAVKATVPAGADRAVEAGTCVIEPLGGACRSGRRPRTRSITRPW